MSKCILQNILEVLKYFNLVSGLCAYGIYKCILRMLIKRPILEGYPQLPAGLGRLIGVRLHSIVQQTVLSAYRVPVPGNILKNHNEKIHKTRLLSSRLEQVL